MYISFKNKKNRDRRKSKNYKHESNKDFKSMLFGQKPLNLKKMVK